MTISKPNTPSRGLRKPTRTAIGNLLGFCMILTIPGLPLLATHEQNLTFHLIVFVLILIDLLLTASLVFFARTTTDSFLNPRFWPTFRKRRNYIVLAILMGVGLLFYLINGGAFSLYTVILSFIIILAMLAVITMANQPLDDAFEEGVTLGSAGSKRLYIFLVGTLAAAGLLRSIAPGNVILSGVLGPMVFFLVPGLALVPLLIPKPSYWLEWVFYAAPLSICIYLIVIMWLNWLHIQEQPILFYAVAALITVISYVVQQLRGFKPTVQPD